MLFKNVKLIWNSKLPYSQNPMSEAAAPFLIELMATIKVAVSDTSDPPRIKNA